MSNTKTNTKIVMAVIPARGGSKSILKKNIKDFAGKPLICHSIDQANKCQTITHVLVTTDSQEIADVCRKYDKTVLIPFLRPAEISEDLSTDLEFFTHLLRWIQDHPNSGIPLPDVLVQMRPTTPVRSIKLIDEMVNTFLKPEIYTKYDSLRTISPIEDKTPFKMYTMRSNGELEPLFRKIGEINEPYNEPRQILPTVYTSNGYLEVIKSKTILIQNSVTGRHIYSYMIPRRDLNDIDTMEDWEKAEKLLQ